MRIDKLLWQLRLTKSRSIAHTLVETGHVRRNGTRVLRASQAVAAGDVLTVPLGAGVRIIEILALPVRRGPATEAQACYRTLDPTGTPVLAAVSGQQSEEGPPQ